MKAEQFPFITPYQGEFNPAYTFQEWAIDVVPYARHHISTIPYQEGMAMEESTPLWASLILIICISAIAYVRSFHRKRFNLLQRTLFNWKVSKQIIRYEKVYTHPVNLILLSIFIICTPTFFALALQEQFALDLTSIELSLWIGIPILAYLISKILLHKFFAWLLKVEEAIEEYLFQGSLFNKFFGIFNLVLMMILLFVNVNPISLLRLSLLILILLLGTQVIRGVLIGVQKGMNGLAIILYLCTLEILPWIIIGKIIQNQF